MSEAKSLKERIEEVYGSTPEPLDGVIEVNQLKKKLEEKLKNSGKSSKSKEAELYQKAISKVDEAFHTLNRTAKIPTNFGTSSVVKLQQEAVEFLAQNYGNQKESPTLVLCSKLILDCKNYAAANKKKLASGKKSTSNDPEKDAAVLAAVEKAIQWGSDGENAISIKEKLLVALKDEKVEHVKYRTDKKGNQKASIFVGGKPMNFDSAKLAAGRALKVESEKADGKYQKSGKRYWLK